MSKINPGSNRNEDNDLATTTPGMRDVNIPEPKMPQKGEFQCPRCDRIFNSKENYISHALAHHQIAPSKAKRPHQLSSVPCEKGFHFFTQVGNYIGITATSLDDFAEKLSTVPVESVMFHFQRDDYQKWLIEVIGDKELAEKIDKIKETNWDSGDILRKTLVQTVQNAIAELKDTR